tara:strand:+ start:774 stop:1139 length:366 start_codon:yes stop_codon:yes gene_type:complete
VKFKALLFFSAIFISCTTNLGTLSIASTEDFDLKSEYINIGIVSGKYQVPWFVIPLRDIRRFDKAIKSTIEENSISYITDLKIDETYVWLYLGGIVTIKVQGIGWRKIESKYNPSTGDKIN